MEHPEADIRAALGTLQVGPLMKNLTPELKISRSVSSDELCLALAAPEADI
jgi:hypothetical protein